MSVEQLEKDFLHDKLVHLREILPHLPENRASAIIELGCGYGSLLSTLSDQGYTNVIGLDRSEGQLELAQKMGIENVLKEDALEYFSDSKKKFDVVIAIDVVEHLTKVEQLKLFQEVCNSLNDGGSFIFRTPNADALRASVYSAGDITHEQILGNNSAGQLCRAAGFDSIKVVPGYMRVNPFFKEVIRKMIWWMLKSYLKIQLFATGRSSKGIIFTPNILVSARKA